MKKSKGMQLGVLLAAMLLISIAVVSAAILPFAETAKGSMSEQSLKISAGPGKQVSWATLPKENISAPKGGREVPVISIIDNKKLEELRNRPYVPSGDKVPSVQDTAPDLGHKHLAPNQILVPNQILAPNLLYNFEGLNNLNQDDGLYYKPPDSTIATGPNYVGVVVNNEIAFYTKTGALAYKTSLENWFSGVCSNGCGNFTDPKIVYDQNEGHWLMMDLAINSTSHQSWYLLFVSQTSDPSSGWNYRLDSTLNYGSTPTWADYPDLGFDGISSANGGAVYITSNQFSWSGAFETSALNILPKSVLYTGGSTFNYWKAWGATDSDGAQAMTLRAALTFGNPDGEYLINSKAIGGNSVSLWKVIPTYPPTPVNWVRQATVSIGSYSLPPNAQQLGCNSTLRTAVDNRIYNAVYRNNSLYAAFTEATNWGNGTVAAIRYLKINTTTNSTAINERFGRDNFSYFYPAITVDSSNNIAIVFSSSSSTDYAGIRYTGRKATDNAIEASALLKAGEICYTGYNWGDYSGIGISPSDGTTVWIYGEWAKNLSLQPGYEAYKWGTWIGEVTY